MTKPVNVIDLKYLSSGSLNRTWLAHIDKKDLRDWLEESMADANPPFHWREKSRALLNIEALKASAAEPGRHAIFICANCAAADYRDCVDLLLHSVRVSHDGDFIDWEMDPPGARFDYETGHVLKFRFHKPQFLEQLKKCS